MHNEKTSFNPKFLYLYVLRSLRTDRGCQMVRKNMRIFVTGATGQIGSELTLELRKRYGNNNVVAGGHRKPPSEILLKSGPFEYIDANNRQSMEAVMRKHDIDIIYHLAAILSARGEENPGLAWDTNIASLYNILEIARKQKMVKVFWPSSIAVFGTAAPNINTPQDTILRPTTMYGVTKVAGELLCNYYFIKFGLDVRSLRYPGIISSEAPPGGGTTDYAIAMFYEALKKKKYKCFLREDTMLPMMYMPDCIKATVSLMEAASHKVKHHDSYNVTSMSFSAGELADEISKHIPEFRCDYAPDFRQEIADSWPKSIDDSVARAHWGWKPSFDLVTMTKDMIDRLSRKII